MGMFDYVRCKYPLPVENSNGYEYQSKDTPAQNLDLYEIREDGTLWGQEYEVEDQSDPNAVGFAALFGCMTRVNERPEFCPITGEIRFYTRASADANFPWKWLEFSAYFVEGHLKQLHTITADQRQEPVLKQLTL